MKDFFRFFREHPAKNLCVSDLVDLELLLDGTLDDLIQPVLCLIVPLLQLLKLILQLETTLLSQFFFKFGLCHLFEGALQLLVFLFYLSLGFGELSSEILDLFSLPNLVDSQGLLAVQSCVDQVILFD